jgi:Uncharacterized protein conserved in bacteria
MPIVSKYSNQQVESLINELKMVLDKHQAPIDLSLLTLGNLATHLIASKLPLSQQRPIAESFSNALLASIPTPKDTKSSH